MKINTPFIESMLEDKLVNLNTIKNVLSVSVAIPLVYGRVKNTLNENYLYDMGL